MLREVITNPLPRYHTSQKDFQVFKLLLRTVKLTEVTLLSRVRPGSPQQLPAGDRRTFKPFLVVLLVLGQGVFVQVVDEVRQQLLPPGGPLVGEQLPRRLDDGIPLVIEGSQEPLDVAGTCGLRGRDGTG